jgi:hypothetical protein
MAGEMLILLPTPFLHCHVKIILKGGILKKTFYFDTLFQPVPGKANFLLLGDDQLVQLGNA